MTCAAGQTFVAVDIGNSRLKFGLFSAAGQSVPQPPTGMSPLPEPLAVLDLEPSRQSFAGLDQWLASLEAVPSSWWIASVNRPHTTALVDWLRQRDNPGQLHLLAVNDLPLVVEVPRPDMVGIDRLVGAVGANAIRPPDRAALVVDLGTAITVDLVSPQGAFQGGAILPGIGMSARALHDFTDLLPHIQMATLADPPPPLGQNTEAAMRSGLYWGAVGGVRELMTRLATHLPAEPQLFLTGGAAPVVAPLLARTARHVPHLVLGGIALVARRAQAVAG